HPRKSEIVAGIDRSALAQMPHYVPGEKPTVPGHEAVVRIVSVGPNVTKYRPGERYLVQTDYRWLPTAASNSAFGYNFEGALQQYVLMDERVITSPQGESMLIPAPEHLSASAIALCEPWACVEDAYAEKQRRTLKPGGRCLVVGSDPKLVQAAGAEINRLVRNWPNPPEVTVCAPDVLPPGQFDDVLYLGADPAVAERLFEKLAPAGLCIILQCGGKFGRAVVTPIGRVHYGGIRIVGTRGAELEAALRVIPDTVEIRPGEKINVVGAAGPMGTMHVIRDLCQGVQNVCVFAGDINDERLAVLEKLAAPLALRNKLRLRIYNPVKEPPGEKFSYIVLLVPAAQLVAQAVQQSAQGAIINIFAGIPANVTAQIDLDTYIERACYFVGTSGSTLEDMKTVLGKVRAGALDTNLSVAAVAGLDGAIDGIRAVEQNLVAGKIVVYPFAKGLGLTPLSELGRRYPSVAAALTNGCWTTAAEAELRRAFEGR
ncbi:MAG: alcohol dehydrogenase catalytic domain-containing protein, partial [Verrucomicrobiales bacterium]|nr:alcohol dehydrogenase catalytic domain-containing protein [Verrucomicrobiales bacterium]